MNLSLVRIAETVFYLLDRVRGDRYAFLFLISSKYSRILAYLLISRIDFKSKPKKISMSDLWPGYKVLT